jgi:hypothetical protein
MTFQAPRARLADVIEMLRTVTGEDEQWAARVTAASRLEGDLRLDSLEIAALGDLLHQACGGRADLPGFLAGLDIDRLIALTVGDLLAYLASVYPGAADPAPGYPAYPAAEDPVYPAAEASR